MPDQKPQLKERSPNANLLDINDGFEQAMHSLLTKPRRYVQAGDSSVEEIRESLLTREARLLTIGGRREWCIVRDARDSGPEGPSYRVEAVAAPRSS